MTQISRAVKGGVVSLALLSVFVPRLRGQTPGRPAGPPTDQAGLRGRVLAFVSRTIASPVVEIEEFDAPDASGLRKVVIRLGRSQQAATETLYVTADGKEILQGVLLGLSVDPWRALRKKLDLAGNHAPSEGPAAAAVTLVEFSDLECPYCKLFSAELADVRKDMPHTVRVVFENYPSVSVHPWALQAAESAVCVAAENPHDFWTFQRLVFARQEAISPRSAESALKALAVESGASPARYEVCIHSPEPAANVRASIALGKELGVSGVPTVFVNGMRIPGAISPDTLRAIVAREAELVARYR